MAGGRLWVEPEECLTDDLADLITAHKTSLLAFLTARPKAPPPCPGDINERIAKLVESGVPTSEAEAMALAELGFPDWPSLTMAWADHITALLDALPAPASKAAVRLDRETRRFLGSSHHVEAIRRGWAVHELFGVHPYAPTVRIEAWGWFRNWPSTPFPRPAR